MNEYQYSLEKYTGRASRHECPQCHDKHSFVLYIDKNTGLPLAENVGRCNHEDGCGYHYTPKEYFADHPSSRQAFHQRTATPARTATRKQEPAPSFMPFDFVEKSASYNSDLVKFLCTVLTEDELVRVVEDYAIGATKGGDVIFWLIDINGKVRTGKVMKYNPEDGHRSKDAGGIDWIHKRLERKGLLKDFNLRQCLFGEHLLRMYPDKPVALVESEKSALIGAAAFIKFIWLATGGESNINADKMRVLRGKTVVLFPDTGGGYEDWCRRAKDIESVGCRLSVSDILERYATDEEKAKGSDIADWIIKQRKAEWAKAEEHSVVLPSNAMGTSRTPSIRQDAKTCGRQDAMPVTMPDISFITDGKARDMPDVGAAGHTATITEGKAAMPDAGRTDGKVRTMPDKPERNAGQAGEAERVLERMKATNPHLGLLIDKFDLQLV